MKQELEQRAVPTGQGGMPRRGEDRQGATEVALAARRAGKRFDDVWVVRGLDFSVERGTIFGLFGPSGSGKTTTLRLLLGLLEPDEGEVLVLGRPPRRFGSSIRARIGYMPQLFVLYPELSVSENLDFVGSLYGLGWLRRRRAKRRILEFVDLWEHRGKAARDLSGGMKRRLQLAGALMHEPDVLVVDEPTAGIDPVLRARFWDHFRALRDTGRTILVTSQYVSEAEYCDHIAMLGRGRIIAAGTPEEVRQQAVGGEVVDVSADELTRAVVETLRRLDGVRAVRWLAFDQLRLTVDQAGLAIPAIMNALGQHGIEVEQVRESRPTFDEVFVKLMEQDDGDRTD